ncbi:MAG: hypothetical protein ACHQQQ_09735 [Bacteroidota bacterium]
MIKYISFLIGILALAGFILSGCSTSNNPAAATTTPTDPSKAKQQVNQANKLLIPTLSSLVSSQGQDTATSNISTAQSLYGQALANDPTNPDAHFGYATTEVLNALVDPDIRALGNDVSRLLQPLRFTFSRFPSTSGLLSNVIPQSMIGGGPGSFPVSPMTFYPNRQTNASHPFSYYQGIIEAKLLPSLADAIAKLQTISQNSSFAMYIRPDSSSDVQDSIRIDLTEVYLLLACLNFLDANASFVTAYNVDYNSLDSASVYQAWQVSSPFLTFRTNGSQRMKDTKTGILTMAQNIKDGIGYFTTQSPHPGVDLITYNPNDYQSLINVSHAMDSIRVALSGPHKLNGSSGSINIDLSQFFDNAISNYKTKIPAYTISVKWDNHGNYQPVLSWVATSFDAWFIPDPTMNGLFPGMTDSGFKTFFNITALDWKQHP